MEPINLDQDVDEHFTFTLGGKLYKFRYPTTEGLAEISQAGADNPREPLKALAPLFGYVSSDDPDAPDIAESIGKSNVIKMVRFQKAILAKIGL